MRVPTWPRRHPHIVVALATLLIGAAGAVFFVVQTAAGATKPTDKPMVFGATFSKQYATSLGLDWKSVYTAVLDDLGIRLLRIPAYWDDIEPTPGHYDFTDVDWQVQEAAKRGAKVVLAMGMKLPRWPECHLPAWTEGMSKDEIQAHDLGMIRTVIKRYKDEGAIIDWQIENEPLFQFGTCDRLSGAFLASEVAEAHALDSRPVLLQDAGEFSTWQSTSKYADTLGVSLYRLVWDKHFGYVRWPYPPSAYQLRAALAERHVDRVIITELQAEPWVTRSITSVPLDEQLAQMGPDTLRSNVQFAERTGFSEAYFWGVEWWYWVKQQGHPELWDAGKSIVAGPQRLASTSRP